MPSPPLTIHWTNSSALPNEGLRTSFNELQQQLNSCYPELPVPLFQELEAELVNELPDYLLSMLPGMVEEENSFAELKSKFVFVLCNSDEDFVQEFQSQNELAHWGVAVQCKFSIAWESNRFLIWHELLHLMNAKDCYNKFGINKCPEPNCLMRRATSEVNYGYGSRLTLCSKNVTRILRFAANLEI